MIISKGKIWSSLVKRIPCVVAVMCMSGLSQSALAACNFLGSGGELAVGVNFGRVIVQRGSPAGTLLATQYSYNFESVPFRCDKEWRRNWSLVNFTKPSSYSSRIYDTNILGVGIRLRDGAASDLPAEYTFSAGQILWAGYLQVDLIKTKDGAVGAGEISAGTIARVSADKLSVGYVTLGNTTIVPVACSVASASIPVPMGDIRLNSFTGVGSSSPEKSFSIPLNCDATTRVSVTLDGTRHSSGTQGVLALNSVGGGVASGVGLQLLFKGVPVKLGSSIDVGAVTAAGVPLTARYYQTSTTIGPGTANSTATFTMTYQ